jgi:hypothetical protein
MAGTYPPAVGGWTLTPFETEPARFDKRPNDWLSLPTTIEYLEALSRRSVTGLSGNACHGDGA